MKTWTRWNRKKKIVRFYCSRVVFKWWLLCLLYISKSLYAMEYKKRWWKKKTKKKTRERKKTCQHVCHQKIDTFRAWKSHFYGFILCMKRNEENIYYYYRSTKRCWWDAVLLYTKYIDESVYILLYDDYTIHLYGIENTTKKKKRWIKIYNDCAVYLHPKRKRNNTVSCQHELATMLTMPPTNRSYNMSTYNIFIKANGSMQLCACHPQIKN